MGELLSRGFRDVTGLDLSEVALREARAALGAEAARVEWIQADVRTWKPERRYWLWHDRAPFHFLVGAADRERYVHGQRCVRVE